MSKTEPIAVLCAGAWGTALALVLARNGRQVVLWGRNPPMMAEMALVRENQRQLPGYQFPDLLRPTADLDDAAAAADLLVAVPSQGFRPLLERLSTYPLSGRRIAWATKGLDAESGGLLHHTAEQIVPQNTPLAVISGPSFASEVAAGLPTAVTVASHSPQFATDLAESLHSESFRAYTSPDLAGVELGGAVKTVLAVATGIADGLACGANARAALITRGLAELVRLGAAMGADPQTFMGLSGVGDLILTCTDDQSRNRRFGLALGRGASAESALATIGSTVEGLRTAAEVHALASRKQVEMPICEQVYNVLYRGLPARDAVQNLLIRTRKPEFRGS